MELKCSMEISCGYSHPTKIDLCESQSKWENCEAGKLDPQNIEITAPADELEMLIGRMDYYINHVSHLTDLDNEQLCRAIKLIASRLLQSEQTQDVHSARIESLESRLEKLEVENAEYPMSKQAVNPPNTDLVEDKMTGHPDTQSGSFRKG